MSITNESYSTLQIPVVTTPPTCKLPDDSIQTNVNTLNVYKSFITSLTNLAKLPAETLNKILQGDFTDIDLPDSLKFFEEPDFYYSVIGQITSEIAFKMFFKSIAGGLYLLKGDGIDVAAKASIRAAELAESFFNWTLDLGMLADILNTYGYSKALDRGTIDDMRINNYYTSISQAFNDQTMRNSIFDYLTCLNNGVEISDKVKQTVTSTLQLYHVATVPQPSTDCLFYPYKAMTDNQFANCDPYYTDAFTLHWNANKSVLDIPYPTSTTSNPTNSNSSVPATTSASNSNSNKSTNPTDNSSTSSIPSSSSSSTSKIASTVNSDTNITAVLNKLQNLTQTQKYAIAGTITCCIIIFILLLML